MSEKKVEKMDILELTAEYSRESKRLQDACYSRGKFGGMGGKQMYKRVMKQTHVADLIIRNGFGIIPSDLRKLPEEFWDIVKDMAHKELDGYSPHSS